jgi:isoleucyl-tRNA synthetase
MADYKDTIFLPKTDFPMRASLPQREPAWLEMWEKERIYEKVLEKTKDGPRFVFHDGPPYANGNIHHGHVFNKVLKDIIVKYRSLKGCHVRYIPGWDCHGLPIELNAERELGKPAGDADKLSIRRRCHDFAMNWSNTQMAEFKRLGLFSLWDQAYRTILPSYEKTIVEALATIMERGMVYRGSKPVYWCADCATALAEAEVEYQEHASPSVFVKYPVIDREAMHAALGLEDDGSPLSVMIWTTTPWTLPASLVIAVHPKYEYRAFDVGGERVILCEDMAKTTFEYSKRDGRPVGQAVAGEKLEKLRCRHPFIETREIPILLADYVTLEQGTGCVHTAPGHGQEDYVLCSAHGIDVYAPVDKEGRFTSEVPQWQGQLVWEANPKIVQYLADSGALFNPAGQKLKHQYPVCWRCKKPIIFRATPQWFISMDKTELRKKALQQVDQCRWLPAWGHDRIYGMIENRPDWCISRQRVWGVPLPIFHCDKCEEPLVDADVARHVAAIFGEHGSDEWWKREARDLLPPGSKCKACGSESLSKDANIVDVWFESGVSWDAVCRDKEGLGVPVDLYLEGSDQHRGWFHTAMLTAVATMDKAPYKTVLTHGFICNEKGEKLSKSQKNFIPPAKTVDKDGAEILRLWVCYADYRSDIPFSPEVLASLVDAYRKIRNTFRFLLGNLADFDPSRHLISYEDMPSLDKWMLGRFGRYLARLDRAYDEYEFHHIFHQTMELVTVDLSAFYADIIKDRVYCEAKDGAARRSAQTVLYHIVRDMARLLAPVLSFTCEEVWQHLPKTDEHPESVFLAQMPKASPQWEDEGLMARWTVLREVRRVVTKELEGLRKNGTIGNALEAEVEIRCEAETFAALSAEGEEALADLCLVSAVTLVEATGEVSVNAKRTEQDKCPRCWRHGHGIGTDPRNLELCSRCAQVMAEMSIPKNKE